MTPPRSLQGPGRDGRTRIKICGVMNVEMAEVAAEAGADFVGLMHFAGSPRFVQPDTAADIAQSLPNGVRPICVFRNNLIGDFAHADEHSIQLHGQETEEFVRQLRNEYTFHFIIRAIPFRPEDALRWNNSTLIDAMLIEGDAPGEGTGFRHDQLGQLMPDLTKPVILAGGLTPENVGEAIRTVQPWGVDVSSGVESSRGVKDADLIRAFCDAVREADAG